MSDQKKDGAAWVIALAGAAFVAYVLFAGISAPPTHKAAPANPAPLPDIQPINPHPGPKPCPGPRPCPRDSGASVEATCTIPSSILIAAYGGTVGGRDATIQADLPGDLHQKNTGGSDGAGLCVYASMKHTGRWQNDPAFEGLFDRMQNHPGGGYPDKVDKMLAEFVKEKGLPAPRYIQLQGHDERVLGLLKLALKTGRMPGVTYSRSPTGRYGGREISHMVNLVKLTDSEAWILDNNYVGENNYEKISTAEFLRVFAPGWAIINLNPGPPMPPRNAVAKNVTFGGLCQCSGVCLCPDDCDCETSRHCYRHCDCGR